MYSVLILALAFAGFVAVAVFLRHLAGSQTIVDPHEDEWWRAIK